MAYRVTSRASEEIRSAPAMWRLLAREAAISAIINAILSMAAFVLVFGGKARPGADIASDFLVQALIVAFMGALIPALSNRRRTGEPLANIALRAAMLGASALAVPGLLAMGLCTLLGHASLPLATWLAVKGSFGLVLGGSSTLIALRLAYGTTK